MTPFDLARWLVQHGIFAVRPSRIAQGVAYCDTFDPSGKPLRITAQFDADVDTMLRLMFRKPPLGWTVRWRWQRGRSRPFLVVDDPTVFGLDSLPVTPLSDLPESEPGDLDVEVPLTV